MNFTSNKNRTRFLTLGISILIILHMILVFTPASGSSVSQEPLDVQGTVSGNWTKSHGPYYIEGDVTIPQGSTLSIESGVEIYFNGSYSLFVEGMLYANGTASERIVFSTNFTNPGMNNWSSIQFNSTGKGELDFCNVSYATTAVHLYNASGIKIKNTMINESYIGIRLYHYSEYNLIYNCSVINNRYGIYFASNCDNNNITACNISNNYCEGIEIYSCSNIVINGSQVSENGIQGWNDGMSIKSSSNIDLINSSIFLNGGYGLYISTSDYCDVLNCVIYNNNLDGISLSFISHSILYNCDIYENNYEGIIGYNCVNITFDTLDVFLNVYGGFGLDYSNNLKFLNCNISLNDGTGLYLYGSSTSNTIYNCYFSYNEDSGIRLYDSTSLNNITDCVFFHNVFAGIDIMGSSNNNWITDSSFIDNSYGIRIYSSGSNTIKHCMILENYIGLRLDENSAWNEFDNLEIESNNWIGVEIYHSSFNFFYDCNISNNILSGVGFLEASNNFVINSTISSNLKGAVFSGSDSNSLTNCNISYNTNYGIECGSSQNNQIQNSDIYMNFGGIYLHDGSSLDIFDSSISVISYGYDFYFKGYEGGDGGLTSIVFALNTTFDSDKVQFSDAHNSYLEVAWYLNIKVVDKSNNSLTNVPIYIWNGYEGIASKKEYYSGSDGWIKSIICTDYEQYSSGKTIYNPYTISGNIPGIGTNLQELTIDRTQDLYFILCPLDLVPTEIVISRSSLVVDDWAFINTTVFNNNTNSVFNVEVQITVYHEFVSTYSVYYSTILTVTEIAPFEKSIASIYINFTEPGKFIIDAYVDHHNFIEESNETNNWITKTISVFDNPKAVLEVSSTSVFVNDEVVFYGNKSQSTTGTIMKYIFDFGDGTFELETPSFMTTHTYAVEGNYRASLKILDSTGEESPEDFVFIEVKHIIQPDQKPVANFTASPEWGYVNTSFRFESTSKSLDDGGYIDKYFWDFGDDNTSNWLRPSHRYEDDRDYTVSLVVWDTDGDKSEYCNKTINVKNLPPVSILIVYKYEVGLNEAIEFDASSSWDPDDELDELSTVFIWDFGDGNAYSESPINFIDGKYDKKTTYSYSQADIFNVTLTVIDDDGAVNRSIIQIEVKGSPSSPSDSDQSPSQTIFGWSVMWAVVFISFLVAIILAILLIFLHRKKKFTPPEEPEQQTHDDHDNYNRPAQGDTGGMPEAISDPEPPPAKFEATPDGMGMKPKEVEVGPHEELSPDEISPVARRKNRSKKSKGRSKKPKLKRKEDVDEEPEEVEWDMVDAEQEKLKAKEFAPTLEYPEPEPGKVGMEIESEIEPEEGAEEPFQLSTIPNVSECKIVYCRWCNREISGKFIKGRRKKDRATGDEFVVEGPFCSMKCSNEFFKD